MKVLLTGHKGFIGSRIYETLKERGYDIDGIDIGDPIPAVKYDIILHFGARTLIRNSINAPYEYFNDGLALTLKFLEKARLEDAIFVFPTSGSVAEATNPYSLSKKNGVEWISLYERLYNTRSVILKLFNIYGETSRKGAVYLFTNAALNETPIPVYGGGNQVRDFVHVDDLVKCIARIIDGEIKPGEYEVGTGVGTSINSLIQMVEKITGRRVIREEKEFLLREAPSLVAAKPLPINPMNLQEGIRRVMERLMGMED
jgi:nucleoside-diphosphate-sugar epimerase